MSDATEPRLPYAFAKAEGLLLLTPQTVDGDTEVEASDDTSPVIGIRGGSAKAISLSETRRVLGRAFTTKTIDPSEFDRLLSEHYATSGFSGDALAGELQDDEESLDDIAGDLPTTADLLDTDDDAPVIRLINGLIAEAVKNRGSDIHVEPFETGLSVRLRVDGVLTEVLSLPAKVAPMLVSRIKVMARLDIAEKRIPQDGRISLTLGGRALDVRVSTLPARHGERVVLRLLDRAQAMFSVADLGMDEVTLTRLKGALSEPNGIILVTGPTGSGKTTTLYAGLSMLNDSSRNILTVEDPIEYALEGIGQTQVNAKVGMTFVAGLRAILRQDPDVVMVGEIRDIETVEIAIQASLTGHVVLSTIHTNSAISAVTRLRDMGVEPFLLASTIKAILAQRLVRRLCPHCKTPVASEPDSLLGQRLDLAAHPDATLYGPQGCAECGHTGFQGRVGLYELVRVDETLRQAIHDDAREADMEAHAFSGEAKTLLQSGYGQIRAGVTTLEEVLRVCRSDGADDAGL